jgi:hypothetical protein
MKHGPGLSTVQVPEHPDISVANKITGSQTGSQRPQARGRARPYPAIVSVLTELGPVSLNLVDPGVTDQIE